MTQKNEVLTREDNGISLISAGRGTAQEDDPAITERKMSVNTTEQAWILEIEEKTRISRTTPKSVNILVKIIKWLSHLGSGQIDDSCLESRRNTNHNLTIKGIGF
jgi:hypothetical protein